MQRPQPNADIFSRCHQKQTESISASIASKHLEALLTGNVTQMLISRRAAVKSEDS